LPTRTSETDRSSFDKAIHKAIRQAEYDAMRQAYLKKPDSTADADDWSTAKAVKRFAV